MSNATHSYQALIAGLVQRGMSSALVELVAEHYPREACGLLLAAGDKWQLRSYPNVVQADVATDRFELPPTAWADAEDEGSTVLAVWHSHPDASAHPSQADRVACTASGVPWLVMGYPSQVLMGCDPNYTAPLLGREFFHGVLDCYTLVRDHFRTLDIELPNYERADDWWAKGQDLYRQNFCNAGFAQVPVADAQTNDVLLMAIKAPVPNHAAVLVREGVIAHHLHGRLSCEDVWTPSSYWARHCTHALRHRSLL